MDYPGNPSLSQDTKERITSTFGQTLDLARDGRRREAVLGCDFILKLDPLFHPARTLQERLQAGEGAVETGDLDLRQGTEAPAAPTAQAPPPAPPSPVEPSPPAPGDGGGSFQTMQPADQAGGAPAAPQLPESPPSLGQDGGGLSLEPAPAPAPAAPGPAAGRVQGSDTAVRIQELLDEGQVAFEAQEFQKAIDAWSRIFLIDIDHQEAARRIEQARKLKAENERRIDEMFHEATAHRDAGRTAEAKAGFESILALQPNHLAAREQLDQLGAPAAPPLPGSAGPELPPPPSAGEAPGFDLPEAPAPSAPAPPPAAPAAAPPQAAPVAAESGLPEPSFGAGDVGGGAGAPEPAFSDDLYSGSFDAFPEDRPAVEAPPPVELSKGGGAKPRRSFHLLGFLVLVGALGAGWYLYGRWGSIFPNAEDQVVSTPPAVDVVQRATRMHLAGSTEEALAELGKLTPEDPAYDRAQVLIEQWSSEVEGVTANPDVVAEDSEIRDRRDALLARARLAYDEREYLRAAKSFKAASDISPLEGAGADLYDDARRQLRPIAQQIELFQQREWEMVLPMLWRKLEDDPDNRDVIRILGDSYFNLGVRELQRGSPEKAEVHFDEALDLDPADEMAKRLLLFSKAYQQTSRDLLYQIYVKQLRFRR